jgi:hypothetical protein
MPSITEVALPDRSTSGSSRGRTRPGLVAILVVVALAVPVFTAGAPTSPAGAAPGLILVGEPSVQYASFHPGGGTSVAFSSPAIGNVIGDSAPEVVTGGMDGCVRVYSLAGVPQGNPCLWVGPHAVQGSPALVDWDLNGVLDIVASSVGGDIFVWRGNGDGLLHVRANAGIFATPAIGDIDRDGLPDIVASTWDQHVYAWNHIGVILPGWPRFIYDTSWSSPALADLDRDGWLEVIVGADMDRGNAANNPPINLAPGGILWVFRHNGANFPGWPRHVSHEVLWSSPAVADLNGDGSLDIVIGTGQNFGGPNAHWLYAIDRNGNALPGWPVHMPGATMGSPAIGDLDNDGRLDVAAQSSDGSVSFIARDGARWRTRCNRSFGGCTTALNMDGGVSIGDINGDGVKDVVTATEAHLRVLDGRNGNVEYENFMPNAWAPGSTPTIARVGNDTYIAVTLTRNTNDDGRAGVGDRQTTYIWRVGHAAGALPWPMFRNNLKRTGTVSDNVPPTAAIGTLQTPKKRTAFKVSWTGNDPQTGVASFDVDMQQGGGERVRWIDGAAPRSRNGANAAGSAVFYGIPGRSYRFWVRARDGAGNVGSFAAPTVTLLSGDAHRVQPFKAAYAASGFGPVSSVSSPPVRGAGFPYNVIRGIGARPTGGGYEVDSAGGLWAFGGAPKLNPSGYWGGQDVVRGMAMNKDGRGGYVVDRSGGLWPFGNAKKVPGPYWPGEDIARGVALTRDSTTNRPRGYVVDRSGGIHPFGGAPRFAGSGYWPGRDVVRGIATDPTASGGYVLDHFGGIWPYGGAPKRYAGGYWAGQDIARGVAMIGGGARGRGYVLDGAGAVWPFGGAPRVQISKYFGQIVARGLSIAP